MRVENSLRLTKGSHIPHLWIVVPTDYSFWTRPSPIFRHVPIILLSTARVPLRILQPSRCRGARRQRSISRSSVQILCFRIPQILFSARLPVLIRAPSIGDCHSSSAETFTLLSNPAARLEAPAPIGRINLRQHSFCSCPTTAYLSFTS